MIENRDELIKDIPLISDYPTPGAWLSDIIQSNLEPSGFSGLKLNAPRVDELAQAYLDTLEAFHGTDVSVELHLFAPTEEAAYITACGHEITFPHAGVFARDGESATNVEAVMHRDGEVEMNLTFYDVFEYERKPSAGKRGAR